MSETTPQRRVLPARERADSTMKRRASSPVEPATPATETRQKRKYTKRGSVQKVVTPAAGTPAPSTPVEEVLPVKIQALKPLPTSSRKQEDALSHQDYQSIADSAVLAASLHRSRMQWLCEGVFTRYWSKPVKRKGVLEQPPGNPDAKSMSKLGNATMTIEPHVFDVTFYTVKDTSNIPLPYYRHPNQHTAKQTSQPPLPLIAPQQPIQHPAQPSPIPIKAIVSATPVAIASASDAAVKQEKVVADVKPSTPSQAVPAISTPTHPIAHLPVQSVAPAPMVGGASKPATDPVIQMLAARAATDNRLKELMKVVATSRASHEQLKEFQGHIDEFNKIIKQQEAKKGEGEKPKQPPAPAAAHPAVYSAPPRPHPGPPASMGGPLHMAPLPYAGYPPPRAEPFIKHIVVEFHSAEASTDRWLFPEDAVLDIKSNGMEMVASFFVIRKGEDILKRQGASDAGDDGNAAQCRYKADVEYYQPVTALIKATQHRTVETIARAARPLVECQKHMKVVMESKTRAPQGWLVHRLPRDKALVEVNSGEFVDSAVELSNDEDDELRDVYGLC